MESMLKRLIGEGVDIRLDLDPGLKRVKADPSQMSQVLLNLAVNARDAMDGQGTLSVVTRNHGDVVVLDVSDTGTGMDAETAERIFEPFFTTKGVGAGTGLGLSTVYGIVTQSGGSIDVHSAPGTGSTFTVRLPATTAEPGADEQAGALPGHGAERILVVDDDRVVLDLLAQMLAEHGYDVTVCESGREALGLDGDWDLLLTDVVLPEIDGVELARHIRARHVLFMSGYDQEALARTGASLLQKPFGRDELARAVREQLDRSASHAAA
jgi:two-component system cell cycle sensor histidine kinase/response regulator CckA